MNDRQRVFQVSPKVNGPSHSDYSSYSAKVSTVFHCYRNHSFSFLPWHPLPEYWTLEGLLPSTSPSYRRSQRQHQAPVFFAHTDCCCLLRRGLLWNSGCFDGLHHPFCSTRSDYFCLSRQRPIFPAFPPLTATSWHVRRPPLPSFLSLVTADIRPPCSASHRNKS